MVDPKVEVGDIVEVSYDYGVSQEPRFFVAIIIDYSLQEVNLDPDEDWCFFKVLPITKNDYTDEATWLKCHRIVKKLG